MAQRKIETRCPAWFPLGIALALLLLSACGSGEGPPTGPGTDTGSVILKLVWQNAAPTAHEGPPGDDVCKDYGITDIYAVITDQANKTEYKGSWSCDEHRGTIKKVTEGTGYTIAVDGLVAGNADWKGQINNFTVKKNTTNVTKPIFMSYKGDDTTPPTVTTHYPVADATDIYLNSAITATFSENVVAASISSTSCILAETSTTNEVSCTISYDAAAHVISMTPTDNLKRNSNYTVTFTTDIEDLAGLHLASDATWTFATGAVLGEYLIWNGTPNWNASLWN